MAHQSGVAFDFFFDRFTLDNAPSEEPKEFIAAKKVMREKFSTQKAESYIIREALTLRYDGGDIPTSSSRADKVFNQATVDENMKFGLLRDALKSIRRFPNLCCSEDPRTMRK